MLSQGGPRDAAVNIGTNRSLQRHRAVFTAIARLFELNNRKNHGKITTTVFSSIAFVDIIDLVSLLSRLLFAHVSDLTMLLIVIVVVLFVAVETNCVEVILLLIAGCWCASGVYFSELYISDKCCHRTETDCALRLITFSSNSLMALRCAASSQMHGNEACQTITLYLCYNCNGEDTYIGGGVV